MNNNSVCFSNELVDVIVTRFVQYGYTIQRGVDSCEYSSFWFYLCCVLIVGIIGMLLICCEARHFPPKTYVAT